MSFFCENVEVSTDHGELVEREAILAIVDEVTFTIKNFILLLKTQDIGLDMLADGPKLLLVTNSVTIKITREKSVLDMLFGLGYHAFVFRKKLQHKLVILNNALLVSSSLVTLLDFLHVVLKLLKIIWLHLTTSILFQKLDALDIWKINRWIEFFEFETDAP